MNHEGEALSEGAEFQLAVQDGDIAVVDQPVAAVGIGAFAHLNDAGFVGVPHHDIVIVIEQGGGIALQSLFLLLLQGGGDFTLAAAAGEGFAQGKGKVGMDDVKELFGEGQADDPAQELVTGIVGGVQIAVGEINLFAVGLQHKGVLIELHLQLFREEIIEPEVMVAADVNYFTALFTNVRQDLQHWEIGLDDGIFPVVPEVKDIAVEDKPVIVPRNGSQESQGAGVLLHVPGVGSGKFVMEVGDDADSHNFTYW
jgi:hypothetical protein